MIFSSQIFLFWFLPWVLLLLWAAPRAIRNPLLTICSYVFYGWTNPVFVLLMFASTLVDYWCGLAIVSGAELSSDEKQLQLSQGGDRSLRQRIALWTSIIVNLSVLGFFKYWNFGLDVWQELLTQLGEGAAVSPGVLRVTLPLGISFYTFQSMSYCIDVYRGTARATRSLWDFACFVSLFPQLVAGPILRYGDLSEQLRERQVSSLMLACGGAFFSLGLARKVLLANPAGEAADLVFAAGQPGFAAAWLGSVFFAMQIYFDFSGYSDMARGLGLMLGFRFPANFNAPYRAQSLTDFWRRWHISLSGWLRDYLYFPLGGSRSGTARTCLNLILVMLLGGLWHGAAWNFLLWGAVHGVLLTAERLVGVTATVEQNDGRKTVWLQRLIRQASVFAVVCLTWVLFRSESTVQMRALLGAMTGVDRAGPAADILCAVLLQPWNLLVLSVGACVIWLSPSTERFVQRLTVVRALWMVLLLLLSVSMLSLQSRNPFIYFLF